MFVRVRAPLIVSSIFACFTFAYTTEAPIIKDASQYTGAATISFMRVCSGYRAGVFRIEE